MAKMAKLTRNPGPLPRADISVADIPDSIRKLERRLGDLETRSKQPYDPDRDTNDARLLSASINATIEEIFGVGTADSKDFKVQTFWFWSNLVRSSRQDGISAFIRGIDQSKRVVEAAIARLKEKEIDSATDSSDKIIRAYEGLDLHPEIAKAASDLYENGHYSNAIEDAVKALNALVRLRSGCDDRDGSQLMEFVFNPSHPILKFNNLSDQSDRDEQKGFMMMFSGAVAGLRNPRAHRLIQDDPERALEFIAFVSLLAKLLDGATKTIIPRV
jgi:uncharacterized protein (TIGR02391 family)